MDMESILVPLAVFASLVVIVGLITGLIGRWIVNRTLRAALQTSPDNLAIVVGSLHRRPPMNLEIWGLVGVALGAALAVAGLIGDPASRIALVQAALIPGFIGAVLFGQRWLPRHPATNTAAIETAVE